ncbi:MAG: hypothetical protein ACRC0L_06865, partial [Angustibacter sp.]
GGSPRNLGDPHLWFPPMLTDSGFGWLGAGRFYCLWNFWTGVAWGASGGKFFAWSAVSPLIPLVL